MRRGDFARTGKDSYTEQVRSPIRKSSKFTHAKLDPHLTTVKLGELKVKLQRLKDAHPHAAEEVKRLAEMGDLSENAAHSIAKGRLRGINQRILELEDQLKHAEVITPAKNAAAVQLGHRVTIEIKGKQISYLILGSSETDPGQGVISHNSPIGSALLGHQVGDSVNFQSASQDIECRIVAIE